MDRDEDLPGRPAFAVFGGLTRFADKILPLFPRSCKRYVELFCGAGEMVWCARIADREILNDLDPVIVRLHRLIKRISDDRIEVLGKRDWVGNRKKLARVSEERHKRLETGDDIDFLHRELYVRRFSRVFDSKQKNPMIANSGEGYDYAERMMKRLAEARERLKDVELSELDYHAAIRKYDGPETFFFIDPPYPGKDAWYRLKSPPVEEMIAAFKSIKGSAMIVMKGRETVRSLRELGWHEKSFKRTGHHNFPGTEDSKHENGWIITNYKPVEKALAEVMSAAAVGAAPARALPAEEHEQLEELSDAQLAVLLRGFDAALAGLGDETTAERGHLVNMAAFVLAELLRRGLAAPDLGIVREADGVEKGLDEGDFAPVAPSGAEAGRPIKLDEVLDACETAILRLPVVTLVGGLPVHGETTNDIGLLLSGPLDPALAQVIRFRVGRMLAAADPELAQRVQWLDAEEFGGPFTDHVPLFDLVLQARPNPEVIRMATPASPAPEMSEKKGPLPAVLQLHFRGASVHADLRVRVNDHLVGWTFAVQKAGAVPKVSTVEEARKVAEKFSLDGNAYLKAFSGPDRILAVPKEDHPVEWLDVDDKVFEPGHTGASSEESGVMIAVARPKVEFGRQEPHFREFFVAGPGWFSGTLYLRQVAGEGGSPEEEDAGRATPEGELYWVASMARDRLPGVLSARAVERKAMPPDGWSWLPASLEAETPRELHYWTKAGEEARKLRDALVEAKWFTEENVRLVDGALHRVVTKRFLTPPNPSFEPAMPWDGSKTTKAAEKAESSFRILRQSFEGTGAPKVVWWLVWAVEDGAMGVEIDGDPLLGERLAASLRSFGDQEILGLLGPVKPETDVGGVRIGGPSELEEVDRGSFAVVERPGHYELDVMGEQTRGRFVLHRDGEDKRWTVEWQEAKLRKAAPREAPDSASLRPLALFQPMETNPGLVFSTEDDLREGFALEAMKTTPLAVEPSFGGLSIVVERDKEGRVLLFFADSLRDRSADLPALAAAAGELPSQAILLGELQDYDSGGKPKPDLERFGEEDGEVDDSQARVYLYDALHLDGENLTAAPLSRRREALVGLLGGRGLGPLRLAPQRVERTADGLREAVGATWKIPGAARVRIRSEAGAYIVGVESADDALLEIARTVRVLVYELVPGAAEDESGAPLTEYLCAIGPLSESEEKDFDGVVAFDGQPWAPIGRAVSRNVEAKPGDVLRVDVKELRSVDTPGMRAVTWFSPVVQERVAFKPMTVPEARVLVEASEVQNSERMEIQILKRDDSLHYVLGAVLEPNDGGNGAPMLPDAHQDIYSTEDVREAAWRYLSAFAGVGEMHRRECRPEEVEVVESYIAPVDMDVGGQKIRAGTWMLGARILSDPLWEKVLDGRINAWSIDGRAIREPAEGAAS